MKVANIIAVAFLALGMLAAVSVSFVPQIIRGLGSNQSVKGPGYAEAMGFLTIALVGVFALTSVVSAIVAWFAARQAGMSAAMLWSCWLPVPLMAVSVLVLWPRLGR